MNPEDLVKSLIELERIRALLLDQLESHTTQLRPPSPEGSEEQPVVDLLLGARRAVLGSPAAARGLHDLLVNEGRRYATTADGARLRDGLVASAAVDDLRRIWETLSLNVLDGPAEPNAAPDAWAEVLADAVIGSSLNEAVLARLRPEGFA